MTIFVINGSRANYIIESKVQWKPFWLATRLHPQNDWLAGNFPYTMTYAHGPHCFWRLLIVRVSVKVVLYKRCKFCPVFFALSTTEEASHSWGETFGDQKRHRLVCGKLFEKDDSARITQKLHLFLEMGILAESIKRSASDRLGDLVP